MDNPGFLHETEAPTLSKKTEVANENATLPSNSCNPYVIFSDNKHERTSIRSFGRHSSSSKKKKNSLLCNNASTFNVGIRSPKLSSSSFSLPKNSSVCKYRRFSGSLSITRSRTNTFKDLMEESDSHRNNYLSASPVVKDSNIRKCESVLYGIPTTKPKRLECLGEQEGYIGPCCVSQSSINSKLPEEMCPDCKSTHATCLYSSYPKSSYFKNDQECSKTVPSPSLKNINENNCSNSSFSKKEAQRYTPIPSLALLKHKLNNGDIVDTNFDSLHSSPLSLPEKRAYNNLSPTTASVFKHTQSDSCIENASPSMLKKMNQLSEDESLMKKALPYLTKCSNNNSSSRRSSAVELKNKRNLQERPGISTISGQVPMYHPGLFPQQSPRPSADNRRNLRRSTQLGRGAGDAARLKRRGMLRGWKLQFIHSDHPRERRTAVLGCMLAVVCGLVLVATGLVIYVTTVMGSVPEKARHATESGVNVIAGEFRIINEHFEPTLRNTTSADFKQLASQITQQLDLLFSASTVATSYNHSHITQLGPVHKYATGTPTASDGVLVRCKLVLMSVLPHGETANQVGLEFLRGLQHRHGHMWLGDFSIDVQSIGFVAVVEEIKTSLNNTSNQALRPGWSSWSSWSNCNTSGGPGLGSTQSRTRLCRLDRGLGSSLSSIEPCLLIEGAGGDLEVRDCDNSSHSSNGSETVMSDSMFEEGGSYSMSSSNNVLSVSTSVPINLSASSQVIESTNSHFASDPPYLSGTYNVSLHVNSPRPTKIPIMDLSLPSLRHCDECVSGEVCVALSAEQVPICRKPRDAGDPTGCGGHCLINIELCQKLDVDAFRCVDDSYCLATEWRCGNQLCIPEIKRCDGHMNCYDRTDEHNCDCDLSSHFHCGNNTSCLPVKKRCDGVIDCWDGSDELNCTIACPSPSQFTCTNGQCIPHAEFCDGYSDCTDNSDEPFGCGGECKNHEWKCRNGRCIKKQAVCDGSDTCGDLSDEQKCPRIRRENQFENKVEIQHLYV